MTKKKKKQPDRPPPTQVQAVDMICSGKTYTETAVKLGITERTLYRWMAAPGAQQRLAENRRQLLELGTGAMLQTWPAVIARLLRTVETGNDKDASIAGKILLEIGIKAIEVNDLTKTVEVLKTKLMEAEKNGHKRRLEHMRLANSSEQAEREDEPEQGRLEQDPGQAAQGPSADPGDSTDEARSVASEPAAEPLFGEEDATAVQPPGR